MNLAERLVEKVNAECKRIVFIGDVITDHWVHGYTTECQDRCVKFVKESRIKTPGGAANAFRCLSNWKIDTQLYGQQYEDIPDKWRFLDREGKIVFRYDDETPYQWSDSLETQFDIVDTIMRSHGVLLSDYDKGFLTPRLIQIVIKTCSDLNIPCVVDAKRDPSLYRGSVLKCNEDYSYKHRKWWERHDTNYVQTLGDKSPVFRYGTYEQTGWVKDNLPPVKCINHVGAGDCFAAHLTLALVYGFTLENAASFAHSAGRVYVQHPHNRPPTPTEIIADMNPR